MTCSVASPKGGVRLPACLQEGGLVSQIVALNLAFLG